METGIPTLDETLILGIPNGRNLAYLSDPGVEGEVFGIHTLYHNLSKGCHCVYITSSSNPDLVKDQFKEFGWSADQFKEKFWIIDAYSKLIGDGSAEKYVADEPENIESITNEIKQAMLDMPEGSVVLFGSLSTIMDLCGETDTLHAIIEWNTMAMRYEHVIIYNLTVWPYSQVTIDLLKDVLFDVVIKIRQKWFPFNRFFWVYKCDWTENIDNNNNRFIFYRISRPGGVKRFIPKILVTGLSEAERSSNFNPLSHNRNSLGEMGTTIALGQNNSYICHKGFCVDIIKYNEIVDPIPKLIHGEFIGFLLVVDPALPTDYVRARQLSEISMEYGIPCIIIANEQINPDAFSIDEFRSISGIPADIPILLKVVDKKQDLFEVFELLLEMITTPESL